MAEQIVDVLEAIEVEEQHGHVVAVAFGGDQRLIESILQQRAVRQPGQGIVVGDVPDALFGLHALEDLGLQLDVGRLQFRRAPRRASPVRHGRAAALPAPGGAR